MNRFALIIACFAIAGPAFSQDAASPPTDVLAEPPSVSTAKPVKAKKAKKAPASPWSFNTSLRHVSDSNLEQDKYGIASHGLITSLGVEYKPKMPSGGLDIAYTVADHSYTNTDTWDRTTHNFEAAYDRALGRRWNAQTFGEVALKDSSDDGDIRDEYTLQQRLEYRINSVHRVRLEAAYRKKKYQEDPGRDSKAPYVGIAFDQRWSGGRRFLAGYRYEDNHADEAKRSYRRSTYNIILARDLTPRDSVALEAKYRLQRYTERLVKTGGDQIPRRDRRWQVEAAWRHTLVKGLDMRLDYIFENRRSNDSRREFDDHLFGATVTHRW